MVNVLAGHLRWSMAARAFPGNRDYDSAHIVQASRLCLAGGLFYLGPARNAVVERPLEHPALLRRPRGQTACNTAFNLPVSAFAARDMGVRGIPVLMRSLDDSVMAGCD